MAASVCSSEVNVHPSWDINGIVLWSKYMYPNIWFYFKTAGGFEVNWDMMNNSRGKNTINLGKFESVPLPLFMSWHSRFIVVILLFISFCLSVSFFSLCLSAKSVCLCYWFMFFKFVQFLLNPSFWSLASLCYFISCHWSFLLLTSFFFLFLSLVPLKN